MGQGGTGEQTGEEDNVKTFTFQLVYQKERGKEVTGNEEEGKKDGDEEKKDKDTKNGTEPIDTPNTVDICAEVHKELCKSVTNSWEKLVSADREDLVGESSQPCSWKENQRVICYITSESEDISSTSNSVGRGFEVTHLTEPMEEDGQDAESQEDTHRLNTTLCWGDGVRHQLSLTAPQRQDTQEKVYLLIMIQNSRKHLSTLNKKLKQVNVII